MKDKETLIDRIIREKLIINKANLEYCAKNEVINGSLLQSIREAMQAYHEAKMKEVTDADFEEWASVQDLGYRANYYIMKDGAKMGIKAMQNGEIKHNG